MKYVLTYPPMLALPTSGEAFEVISHASIVAIGGVIVTNRFESKVFLALKNNTIEEQELTIVVHALYTWCYYLKGVHYMVVIDHGLLTYVMSQQLLSRRHA